MTEIKPRWGRINRGVIFGLENLTAQQQVAVLQADATVEALHEMEYSLIKGEGEPDEVFNAKKQRLSDAISQATTTDLHLKEGVLHQLIQRYTEFLTSGIDAPDSEDSLSPDILEDDKPAKA